LFISRYLITHIKPKSFKVLTLTTLSTPHRGSPFMDWCRKMFGVGWIKDPKHIPSPQGPFMAKSIKNASALFNKDHQQKRHQHRQSFSRFFSKALNKNDKKEGNNSILFKIIITKIKKKKKKKKKKNKNKKKKYIYKF